MSWLVRVISRSGRSAAAPALSTVSKKALAWHPARARGLHEHSTRNHEPNGETGQARVGPQRRLHVRLALGERRRIDDHQSEAPVLPIEIGQHLERVADPDLVGAGLHRRKRPIPFHVARCCGQRRCRQIDAEHRPGTAGGGVHAESARRREHVEHVESVRHRSDQHPVRPLVEERARLLTVPHVRLEGESSLTEHDDVGDQPPGDHVAVGESERLAARHRPSEPQHHPGCRHRRAGDIDQRAHEGGEVRKPRRRVDLDDEHVRIAIDDQAGQAVALPVDHPVPEFRGVGRTDERRPTVEGRGDRRSPPRLVDRRRGAVVQHLDADRRCRIEQTDRGERPPLIEHDGEVTGTPTVGDRGDRVREHPRVAGAHVAERIRRHTRGQAALRRRRQHVELGIDGQVRHLPRTTTVARHRGTRAGQVNAR